RPAARDALGFHPRYRRPCGNAGSVSKSAAARVSYGPRPFSRNDVQKANAVQCVLPVNRQKGTANLVQVQILPEIIPGTFIGHLRGGWRTLIPERLNIARLSIL